MPFIPYAAVSQSVTPSAISGLIQWYDAGQQTGKADQDRCTTVDDRSGVGNTLTGATGPKWRSSPNGIGGYPAYEWSGGGDDVSNAARIIPLSGMTIFFVLAYTSGRPFGLEANANASNALGYYNGGWIIRDGGGTYDIGPAIASGQAAIVGLRIGTMFGCESIGNLGGGRNTHTAWGDAGQTFHLGSGGDGLNDYTGKVAEWLSWNRELTNQEWYGVAAYFRGKYTLGLT